MKRTAYRDNLAETGHHTGAVRQRSPGSFLSVPVIFLILTIVLTVNQPAQAYIGPGAGFAVLGSFLVMLGAMAAAVVTMFTWPIRWIFRSIRGRRALARSKVKKLVILGLDGLDPGLANKFMADGKLPNFARLRDQGCFHRLQTTVPSISPVAWSSFQTGSNPGKHNIFDFLTRDKKTYLPKLSSVSIHPPPRKLKFGKYEIPIGKADVRLLRKGKPFWHYLGEHGIFSNVLRVPITFPPEKFKGVTLSAMCVPDLRGSQGTFSFFTTRKLGHGEYIGGERTEVIKEKISNGTEIIRSELIGPNNPILAKHPDMKCPFTVTLTNGKAGRKISSQNSHQKNADSPDITQAVLKVNGETFKLEKGKYTDWITVEFKAGLGIKVRGICQFLLLNTAPDFELYVTPINIDPEKPAMPIAYPMVYSTYFAKQQGSFATLGLAEDTWALNNNILDDQTFLHQCIQGDQEREKMFFDALAKVKRGLVVCVFDGTDRVQHTFWRYLDGKHPARDFQKHNQQRDAIEKLYQRMDKLVGQTMKKCAGDDTVLMIMSDHGFNTFRYGVDLNRWLEENGYLVLKENGRGEKYLTGIDWSQTRAFAVGLSGMFLNLKGREAQGIVDPGTEATQLREEIAQKLTSLMDPQRNTEAVKQVYNAQKIYSGPYKNEAPDLLVGYKVGYRASWETAVGQVTEKVFHDNTKAWSGDHCIDRSLVPGVLFCNRKINTEQPRIIDVGPTVLDLFGVDVPQHMDGKPLEIVMNGEKVGSPSAEDETNQKTNDN